MIHKSNILSSSKENKDIYTDVEARYKAMLLKKKARSLKDPGILEEIHQKARLTIEVLTENMVN